MLAVFLKTVPFFALIGLGFASVRMKLFSAEGTALLTRFVFFFPLSALLFGFSATLPIGQIFDPMLGAAYLTACVAVYLGVMTVALFRGAPMGEAAIEAQCATIGNTGFFGLPLITLIVGPEAAGPMLFLLLIDSLVFSAVITAIVAASRARITLATFGLILGGLARNPMVLAVLAGFLWSTTGAPLPGPVHEFVTLLSAAATPAALFAIGGSLASRSAERLAVASWLSFAKLVMLPVACIAAAMVFPVAPFPRAMMIIYAAMPVAGNVFMLAQHYGLAPQRVSTAILVSTAISVLTLPVVIHWALP